VVDDYAQRKIEEEEARGYPSDEDRDFKEDEIRLCCKTEFEDNKSLKTIRS